MEYTIKSNRSNPSIEIATFYEVFFKLEEEIEEIAFSSSATRCKFSDDLKLLADVMCDIAFVYKGRQIFARYSETDVKVDFNNFVDVDCECFEIVDVTIDQIGQSERLEMIKREVSQGLKIQIGFERID